MWCWEAQIPSHKGRPYSPRCQKTTLGCQPSLGPTLHEGSLCPRSHLLRKVSPYPVTDPCECVIVWPGLASQWRAIMLRAPGGTSVFVPSFNRRSSLYTPSWVSCMLPTTSEWASQGTQVGHFLACSWAPTWHWLLLMTYDCIVTAGVTSPYSYAH